MDVFGLCLRLFSSLEICTGLNTFSFSLDLPYRTDASPLPLRKVEKALASRDCDGPREDSHEDVCARRHEDASDEGAVVASDRGKDNIDTSPRSSSSHPPGPAPQSRPGDWRTRTLHHHLRKLHRHSLSRPED